VLYKRVKVQTFFRTSGLQQYFVVEEAAGGSSGSGSSSSSSSSDVLCVPCGTAGFVDERLAEWKLTRQAHKQQACVIDAHVAKIDKTGWFRQIGWLEHFASCNLAQLAY
jgi:hypothetical protein